MLINLLNEYLDITKGLLKIEDFSSMDSFDSLLEKRALIQVDIDNEPKEEVGDETRKIIETIMEADLKLSERIKNEMEEIQEGLKKVKKDRLTHGKNKLAFQKFAGNKTGGTGYYFDRKK